MSGPREHDFVCRFCGVRTWAATATEPCPGENVNGCHETRVTRAMAAPSDPPTDDNVSAQSALRRLLPMIPVGTDWRINRYDTDDEMKLLVWRPNRNAMDGETYEFSCVKVRAESVTLQVTREAAAESLSNEDVIEVDEDGRVHVPDIARRRRWYNAGYAAGYAAKRNQP